MSFALLWRGSDPAIGDGRADTGRRRHGTLSGAVWDGRETKRHDSDPPRQTEKVPGQFPRIEPHDSGLLDVRDGQQIYWEVGGNPDGRPAVVLHGGPGPG
jgi:hypothetical protein